MFKFLTVVLLIIIIWVTYMQFIKPKYDKIYMEELLLHNLPKTGDIILFKAMDNLNSVFIGNYFTHIGIVYKHPIITDNIPYIFEASGVTKCDLQPYHSRTGIFFSPLDERLKRFRGYMYYKELSDSATEEMNISLLNFIQYAINNMSYEYNLLLSGMSKIMGEPCLDNTNCGEITFLSLVNMGLIGKEQWNKPLNVSNVHYLRWMCKIRDLNNGYKYNDIVEIIKTPFV